MGPGHPGRGRLTACDPKVSRSCTDSQSMEECTVARPRSPQGTWDSRAVRRHRARSPSRRCEHARTILMNPRSPRDAPRCHRSAVRSRNRPGAKRRPRSRRGYRPRVADGPPVPANLRGSAGFEDSWLHALRPRSAGSSTAWRDTVSNRPGRRLGHSSVPLIVSGIPHPRRPSEGPCRARESWCGSARGRRTASASASRPG